MFPSLMVGEYLTTMARPGAWDAACVYKAFPRLQERRRNLDNQLSGGEQQMVIIARALAANPTLLLLDEPMEGFAPIIVQELGRVIRVLVEEGGMVVILAEQHARLALQLTQRALVLNRGRVVHVPVSTDLLADAPLLQRFVTVAQRLLVGILHVGKLVEPDAVQLIVDLFHLADINRLYHVTRGRVDGD